MTNAREHEHSTKEVSMVRSRDGCGKVYRSRFFPNLRKYILARTICQKESVKKAL